MSIGDTHFLQERGGIREVTHILPFQHLVYGLVGLADGAPVEAVDSQHCSFETVAHVGHVRQPLQILRDHLQAQEKSTK